jgi:hypothetical protein
VTYKLGRGQMRIPCCVFDLGVISIKRLRRAIALSTTSRVYLPNLEVAPSIHPSREQMPQQHFCNTGMPSSSASLQTYYNQIGNCFGQPPIVSPAFIILIVMCIGAFALATTSKLFCSQLQHDNIKPRQYNLPFPPYVIVYSCRSQQRIRSILSSRRKVIVPTGLKNAVPNAS